MALPLKKRKKKKWNEKHNGNLSDDQWKHVFSQPFIETDDTKLQTLQLIKFYVQTLSHEN